ncbi:MAG: STAS domain-containing protein [Actinobacteria bacterium]|nr:MAG: STAS domain-containing protein [Actinomycetota bacterium]
MLNFEITTEPIEDGVVLHIRGDLDIQSVRQARAELDEVEHAAPDLLVLDLGGLSFCDSTGMGLITATHLKAAEASRRCVIVRPRQPIYQAFAHLRARVAMGGRVGHPHANVQRPAPPAVALKHAAPVAAGL